MSDRRLFFTSIPKCGKNIVYSFYSVLGLRRSAYPSAGPGRGVWPDGLATWHNGFRPIFERGTYAFPQSPVVEDAAARITGHIAKLPSNMIAHHHFFPHVALLDTIHAMNLPVVFVYRHPRDVLVSMLNYARAQHSPEHVATKLSALSDDDALSLLLTGDDDLAPFADYFEAYAGWRSEDRVVSLRFEDLIGSRGGGSDAAQHSAAVALAALIGVGSDDPIVSDAQMRMFNPDAGTFFRGQIGAWHSVFSAATTRLYEKRAGWLDEAWGY